ncbi:hypothetical protein BN2476_350162 [Paraburkholderia piptadeniae]|uniref:Uncharacterized protein n=1 Tax=Paraburkholderia piptadeniae TaxID=1701573 RepID=A0A1N7S871_9BURK|nr:hypothetical protein BN2476_350162 [Paraburkholderia piptadeniae]
MRVRRTSTAASSTTSRGRENRVALPVARAPKTRRRAAPKVVPNGTILPFYDSLTVTTFRGPNVWSIHAHRGQIF